MQFNNGFTHLVNMHYIVVDLRGCRPALLLVWITSKSHSASLYVNQTPNTCQLARQASSCPLLVPSPFKQPFSAHLHLIISKPQTPPPHSPSSPTHNSSHTPRPACTALRSAMQRATPVPHPTLHQ